MKVSDIKTVLILEQVRAIVERCVSRSSVADGKITSLTLDSYEDDKSYMEKAKAEIFSAIIGQQNTNADTVSGATYSSKGLIQAVQNALKEAGISETAENGSDDKAADKAEFISAGRFRNLVDGVYTGSADAFRGDVEVQVTVENQQVRIFPSSHTVTQKNIFSKLRQL